MNSFSSISNFYSKTPPNNGVKFKPTMLDGCVLWLDAKDVSNNGGTTLPANNALVYSWKDKSCNTNDATSINGVTWNNNTLNGNPSFYFNGNGASNVFNGSVAITNNNTMTVFILNIFTNGANNTAGVVLSLGQLGITDSNSASYVSYVRYNNRLRIARNNKSVYPPSYTTDMGSPYVNIYQFDGTTAYVNTLVGSSTTSDNSLDPSGILSSFTENFNITNYSIGTNMKGDSYVLTGYVSEIIVYKSYLSLADRQKVEGYLSWKWGVQNNLPPSHPYYPSLPTIPISTVASYTPSSTNLKLWLDANDISGDNTNYQPPNGTFVTTWANKATSNPLTYAIADTTRTGVTGVKWNNSSILNKYPAFEFDKGSTSALNFGGSFSITNNKMTIMVVSSLSSTSGGQARLIGMSRDASTNDYGNISYMAFNRKSNSNVYGITRNGFFANQTYSSTIQPYDSPFVSFCMFDGTNAYANTLVGNNTAVDKSVSSTGNFGISYFSVGSCTVSSNTDGPLQGAIAEILVYDTNISIFERQRLEGYLSWKWGLQTKLPANHPYSNS